MKIQEATAVVLTEQERLMLESMVRSPKTEQRLAERARIVLLAADGLATRAIHREVGCTIGTASKWRVRFARHRLAGLQDLPRPGSMPVYGAATNRRIVAKLDEPPPRGYARWTAPLLSAALGDVSDQYIWRFLRTQRIDLAARKSWCVSTDPHFVPKSAEIVGLYLDPPDRAVVLCVDEKSQIQALDRTQPLLPMRPGQAERRSHDYKRHGTLSLFAALDVQVGKVVGRCFRRHRAQEFRKFLDTVEAEVPDDLDVHLVIDNAGTHKTKRIRDWFAKRPRWHVHFTPTSASWINQVERFFGLLTDRQVRRGVYHSTVELEAAIHAYIDTHNAKPKPFRWTKSADDILAAINRFCRRTLDTHAALRRT